MFFAERMGAMAQELGWSIEYDNRNNTISICAPDKSVTMSQEDSAENVIFQLLAFFVDSKRRQTSGTTIVAKPDRLDDLEKRVKTLEEAVGSLKQASSADREYYVELFRKKKIECEELGAELTIDLESCQTCYRNPNRSRRPFYYDISQSGYRKLSDTLRQLKKNRSHK